MHDRFKYILLLSSLPLHPKSFISAKQTPLSRIQLDKRLALLSESDAAELARIESILRWGKNIDETDQSSVKANTQLLALIKNPILNHIVSWRLELRTVLSALRIRQAGISPATADGFYGYGKWPELIKKNWHEKEFGIGHLIPWLPEANKLFEAGDSLELEKFMLDLVWQYYARLGNDHYFDFVAVVIYVLRWDLISRWSSYDRDEAKLRFDELVSAGLVDF